MLRKTLWRSHLIGGSCPELLHLFPVPSHCSGSNQGEGHQIQQGRLAHSRQQHHSKCRDYSQQISYRKLQTHAHPEKERGT